MRLCSDNALATATRGRHSPLQSMPHSHPQVASRSCCKLQAEQPALLLRAHLLPGQRRTKIWDTPYQLVCICAPRAIPAPTPWTPSAAPSPAAAAAAFAFKHFHLPLKRSCCRFIVFVFLLVAIHCPAAASISPLSFSLPLRSSCSALDYNNNHNISRKYICCCRTKYQGIGLL